MRAYLIRESSNELAPTSLQVNQSLKTSKGKAPSNKFPYLCQPIILAASRVPSLDDKSQVDTVDDEKTQIILPEKYTQNTDQMFHSWSSSQDTRMAVRDSLSREGSRFVTFRYITRYYIHTRISILCELGGGGLWGLRGSGFSDHLIGPNFVHRNN